MVELQTPQLDAVFHALGDATRRRMLRELAEGERSVGELAEPFDMSLAAASKHIKVLENGDATRQAIVAAFAELAETARRKPALFYFAGKILTDRLYFGFFSCRRCWF